ncbi:MFS transporter [Acinetobacter pittii]|uniref:MFS transporter n=1 Tax=Acinetobacter pittii TaxID=48296 RepID=UPI000837E27D|nr:MFS transporter [Acinetobacter pittii]MBN6537467.1 MFS transporter [Acinetobacter pittii]MEB6672220.1 MFS transporter [Acinetobacter pittii]OCY37833.1 MFS transporter [Acinetobacter pittii]
MNTKSNETSHQLTDEFSTQLPIWKLLAFTVTGFLTIMTETMPAGLLPQISQGLHISEAYAGQLIAVYALGSVLAAIPLISLTRSWNRRPLLLSAIAGLLLFNAITALSNDYTLTLSARFIAGMAAGVIWGLLAGYVRRMVSASYQGRALAIAGVGQPIALSIGVPLGAWLGTLFEWRGVFWIMSLLALILFVWIRFSIPDFVGQSAQKRLPILKVLLMPGIRAVLAVVFLWILAHSILYTYISPFLASTEQTYNVETILFIFGISSIVGILITGMFIDRSLRKITLLSLFIFAIATALLGIYSSSNFVVLTSVVLWGVTFGGAPTLLQTALANTAGHEADVAQSMLVTVFNLAIAFGGMIGGGLLESFGAASFPWFMLIFALIALCTVYQARKHGFISS